MIRAKEALSVSCQRRILQNVTVNYPNGLFAFIAFLRSATQCIIKVFNWWVKLLQNFLTQSRLNLLLIQLFLPVQWIVFSPYHHEVCALKITEVLNTKISDIGHRYQLTPIHKLK